MYKIGLFSQITKTTIKALRYYDRLGLLKPEQVDSYTGYRYYTTQQIEKLYEILAYRQANLSMKQIKQIMLDGKDVKSILEIRKQELTDIQEKTAKQVSLINYLLKEKKEGFFMEYTAIIKDLPECIVYSKEFIVPDYNSYFELIPAIGAEITKANPTLKCLVPEYCFIKYLENEYKEKNIHIEFCEAVEKMGNATGSIIFKKIESVKAVCVMHKGAYKNLNKAYAYAFQWMEENNYELSESPREHYIDGVWNKEKEEDWLTELQCPIKKKEDKT